MNVPFKIYVTWKQRNGYQMKEDRLYKIEYVGFGYCNDDFDDVTKTGYSYPICELYTSKSLNEIIEQYIKPPYKGITSDMLNDADIHHILVTEIPTDVEVIETDFRSQYLFDGNGNQLEAREYSSDNFQGRDAKTLRFKKGDKVEILTGDGRIYDGIVYDVPISDNDGKGMYMDRFDDSYIVFVGWPDNELPDEIDEDTYMEYHEHVEVINIFERKYYE